MKLASAWIATPPATFVMAVMDAIVTIASNVYPVVVTNARVQRSIAVIVETRRASCSAQTVSKCTIGIARQKIVVAKTVEGNWNYLRSVRLLRRKMSCRYF